MRNKHTFDAPLQVDDSETQSVGCRHTNPDICAKNSVPNTCAFTNKTNICTTPPSSWPKKFWKLKSESRIGSQNSKQQQLARPQDCSSTLK